MDEKSKGQFSWLATTTGRNFTFFSVKTETKEENIRDLMAHYAAF